MLIKIATVLWQVSFVFLQSSELSSEDEINLSDAAPPSISEPPVFSPESSTSVPVTTSNSPPPVDQADIWDLNFLNYSAVYSLYDSNVQYLNSAKDNMKLVYDYLVARLISLLTFVPSEETFSESENYAFLSRLSWSALSYHLYTLQTVLCRTETIAIICIALIVALIVHSLFHYRQTNGSEGETVQPSSSQPLPSSKAYTLFWKLLRFLNFTIIFSNLFSIVDAAVRNFRSAEAVIIQQSSAHAGVYSCQGRRGGMEDTFTLKNNISKELGIEFYACYDGHGGRNAAIQAEKEIFDMIAKRIKETISESNKENASESESRTCQAGPCLYSSSLKSVPSGNKNPSSDAACASLPSPSSPFISSIASHKTCAITSGKSTANRFDALTVSAMKSILHDEITSVDARLVEQFRKRNDISGSTAIIAVRLIHLNTLLVANVGDSRAVACDWKGATIPLSFDHKPYQLKEYRRIVEAGGYIMLKGVYRVNGILAVSRALGDYPLKEDREKKTARLVISDPDILSFDLNELKARFMIVASDGFWDTFSNENAVQYVRNELSRYSLNFAAESQANVALSIAKKLANEAYTRESYDNITVIVVLFEDVPPGASPTSGNKIKIGQASSATKSTKPLSTVAS